ncbi:MAG: 50S ribosomal protein L15 [Chloroflexi bacterium]|nr:50S ribosomal protein L15 [Chloroflexota bacterium]
MRLDELAPPRGARKERRRVGRGLGSGRGTTAGKGTKGQKARTGGSIPPYFEGGQLPLVRRLPYRRGFRNPFRREYHAVNVAELQRFPANAVVDVQALVDAGLSQPGELVKILGDGDVRQPLVVRAHRFSRSAQARIESAGGTVEVIEHAERPA